LNFLAAYIQQVWTVIKRCVAQRTEILKDRHLHHVILCRYCRFGVCAMKRTELRVHD
ncbi:unnamed protein product, partial [Ectocarpus sp. 4 AP-2014]